MAEIINGKALAESVIEEIKVKVGEFKENFNRDISLAVILVGENPASKVYVNNKIKTAERVGIKSFGFYLPETASQSEVEETVISLANDEKIDGILVQLPLPKGLDQNKILKLIPADKDVDGFLPESVGNLLIGNKTSIACTPNGIIRILKAENIPLEGKNAVVVGRSNIVGKPLALLLLKENCTVTVCHSKTKNLKSFCKNADILIVAVGKPKLVTKDMVKKNAVVIDVGITRTEKGLCGDVDFDGVKKKASFITPVPGGVGPMTVAMLMENTLTCAYRREKVEF